MNCLKLVSYDLFFVRVKMSYYWLNRQELSTKVRDRHHNGGGKKKAAKYYNKNREVLRKEARNS